jgi:oxalate decarboxylase/phosphoglucose isomerase-like protein (cupin superfamily)
MESKIQISELSDGGDEPGFSFTTPNEALAFLQSVNDVHMVSVQPGAIRGNHDHLRRREAIVLFPGTSRSFDWDEARRTTPQHRNFSGNTAVMILVSPGASHAIRNDGGGEMWLVAIWSEAYDPTETVSRKVI